MMLEEYRMRTVEGLKACPDIVSAQDLLSQVNLVLTSTGISHEGQKSFWDQLARDVSRLEQESTWDAKTAAAHSAVIATARAVIAQYRTGIASGQKP